MFSLLGFRLRQGYGEISPQRASRAKADVFRFGSEGRTRKC